MERCLLRYSLIHHLLISIQLKLPRSVCTLHGLLFKPGQDYNQFLTHISLQPVLYMYNRLLNVIKGDKYRSIGGGYKYVT